LDLKGDIPGLRVLDLADYSKSEEVASLSHLDKVVFVISS
jgi:hypothetical protein